MTKEDAMEVLELVEAAQDLLETALGEYSFAKMEENKEAAVWQSLICSHDDLIKSMPILDAIIKEKGE